jgi:hypothetical protein
MSWKTSNPELRPAGTATIEIAIKAAPATTDNRAVVVEVTASTAATATATAAITAP